MNQDQQQREQMVRDVATDRLYAHATTLDVGAIFADVVRLAHSAGRSEDQITTYVARLVHAKADPIIEEKFNGWFSRSLRYLAKSVVDLLVARQVRKALEKVQG